MSEQPVEEKPVVWIGKSREVLTTFPVEVKRTVGVALRAAQEGEKHEDAKPLKGYNGAGVLEVVESHDGNAYRAVYTVKFAGVVYVLHAFEKKSKRGSKTPPNEMDAIDRNLKKAQEDYDRRTGKR